MKKQNVSSFFPANALPLLTVRGSDLISSLGLPALREVVTGVLIGINIRSATEMLTRRRIATLNAALIDMYVMLNRSGISIHELLESAKNEHFTAGTSRESKMVLKWVLGLTQKQVQNVLRSDQNNWVEYLSILESTLDSVAANSKSTYGSGNFFEESKDSLDSSLAWEGMLSMAIGSQTLSIRGSEKSLYGKFFEKMMLGSVLSVLGIKLSQPGCLDANSFWLSSRDKRESDATLIWTGGIGVRFDIGFIGAGNTEITLDKVSRFAKHVEISGESLNMTTVIIVDRIGSRSNVFDQARAIDGHVIQMSNEDWVNQLAELFSKILPGYTSGILPLKGAESQIFIKRGVDEAPLEEIYQIAVALEGEDVDPGKEED